jgi:hypothetical protein
LKTENKKLFGRWHEFSLVVLGSILTLFGGILVFELQSKDQQRQHELQRRERRISDACEFLDGLSRLMVKQIYILTEVASIRMQTTNSAIINEQNTRVLQAQQEWGQEALRAAVLTKLYFGDDLSKEFQDEIAPELTRDIYQKCLAINPGNQKEYQGAIDQIGMVSKSVGNFIGRGYTLIDSQQLAPNQR